VGLALTRRDRSVLHFLSPGIWGVRSTQRPRRIGQDVDRRASRFGSPGGVGSRPRASRPSSPLPVVPVRPEREGSRARRTMGSTGRPYDPDDRTRAPLGGMLDGTSGQVYATFVAHRPEGSGPAAENRCGSRVRRGWDSRALRAPWPRAITCRPAPRDFQSAARLEPTLGGTTLGGFEPGD
jgi:hypothetical protein